MKAKKPFRPKARRPRGFEDRSGSVLRVERHLVETASRVYDDWGFEPLQTSAFEYADALGKFLPDEERPNEGVFALEDDDGQWLSLRYDHTAPLARYVAENFQDLNKPYRRYQAGDVWRNEKPGPGRFRQFVQCDADTVGAGSPSADAEMIALAADVMRAVGLADGDYVVRVNDRRILDGVLESIGAADPERRMRVLRAADKLDRLGRDGVAQLLGEGRKDESGDYTEGAKLDAAGI
ncbi:MAG: histidyl-tRNA synthetase, partial [Maricaulis maris]